MERLRVIDSIIRPSKRFEFSWDKMSQYRGLRTKDLIAPNVLDFAPEGRCDAFCSDGCLRPSPRHTRLRGRCSRTPTLRPSSTCPYRSSSRWHLQPIAQSDALAMVKRQLDWMDKEIIDEQMAAVKKGYDYSILPPELRYSKEEAEERSTSSATRTRGCSCTRGLSTPTPTRSTSSTARSSRSHPSRKATRSASCRLSTVRRKR